MSNLPDPRAEIDGDMETLSYCTVHEALQRTSVLRTRHGHALETGLATLLNARLPEKRYRLLYTWSRDGKSKASMKMGLESKKGANF
jgi:hypothetical protein